MALLVKRAPVHLIHSSGCRSPMVCRRKLPPVLCCKLLVRILLGRWLNMMFFHGRQLLRPWPGRNAARAIKALAVAGIMHHRTVGISVMNDRPVNIHYRGVIPELPAGPLATGKPNPAIAITIVNATVITYMRPPVTSVKTI
jgi:hypothetical protein